MKGIFGIDSAPALLSKLKADHSRVAADPLDAYAAYDFVVTAWHLLEWALPGDANLEARTALCTRFALLRVCEHLAVGAKHFEPNAKRHASVARTSIIAKPVRGTWEPESLVIYLDIPYAQYGTILGIRTLANLMLAFWTSELSPSTPGRAVIV